MAKQKVAKKSIVKNKANVFELTISLDQTFPLVWRKVLVHDFITLDELHILIQASMGWENRHLYDFNINNKTYTDEESAIEMNSLVADGVELRDILGDTKKFTYTYDFGDDWKHDIEITSILENDKKMLYPVCIGGENACPPEDCGGPHGFEKLKEALLGKDKKTKDQFLTWLGGYYNPTTFDPNFVNRNFLWNPEDF